MDINPHVDKVCKIGHGAGRERRRFANRFSLADWGTLCRDADFNAAVKAGDYATAEVIAHRILTGENL